MNELQCRSLSLFRGSVMRLLRIAPYCVVLTLAFTPRVTAQQNEHRVPVDLVVRVHVDSMRNSAPSATKVQLQDGYGQLEREKYVDDGGSAEFDTFTTSITGVTKRIRVFGPDIQEYTENIDIERMEGRKIVDIVVRATMGAATLSVGGSVPASRLHVPEKAQKEFQKGSESLAKKDWPEASKHFHLAIAEHPDYDVAYNGLGLALASGGDSKGARPAFEKAISLNENFAEAYRNLAKISLTERNLTEVDTLLVRSLSADPTNGWALAYAAYAELQLHKFEDAVAHARKAHSVEHKGLASCHTVAALALEGLNRQPEALLEYETYLQEEPNGRDAARAKQKIALWTTGQPPK